MKSTARPILLFLPILVFCASTGCAFLEARGRDFADCWKGHVGVGAIAEATVQVGPIHVSAGAWMGPSIGIHGKRGLQRFTAGYFGFPFTNLVVPVVILFSPALGPAGESVVSPWTALASPLGLLCTSVRAYETGEGKDRIYLDHNICVLCVDIKDVLDWGDEDDASDWTDYFWISVSAHAFVGGEFGFNLAEFADFLLGFFGIDLCGDDLRGRAAAEKSGGDADGGDSPEK